MNRFILSLSLAAFTIAPTAYAMTGKLIDVQTPHGVLQYNKGFSGNGIVVKTVNSVIYSNPYAGYATAGKPYNTANGSAILMTYNSGGTTACRHTYQWISLLPGGEVKHTKVFGSCYYVSHPKLTNKDAISFNLVSVKGKGKQEAVFSIPTGAMSIVSSHMVSANAPTIIVDSWNNYIPVYGTIVKAGVNRYFLKLPQKTKLTGNDMIAGNGTMYVTDIVIEKLSVPASDIGKPMHFMAQIAVPNAGPMINDIRP